jgi:hypothetical protein
MHAQESQQARHRAAGGRGYGREAGGAGPVEYTPPRREGGRHRAPDEAAAPSTEFANVPMQQRGSLDSPPSGFRRVPPFPTAGPASAPVPAQGAGAPDVSGGPRRTPDVSRSPHPSGPLKVQAPTEDEPVTVPVRRADLDRTWRQEDREAAVPRQRRAPAEPVSPALRPLAVRERSSTLRPGAFGTGTYGSSGVGPARPRTAGAARQPLPWERPIEGRLGLVGTVVGAVGVLLGLAPWSGLLPRVMPAETLGSTPLFSLIGALCGVVALGIGAFAMFRADGVGRSLLLGVGSACLGAAAVVVGLTL